MNLINSGAMAKGAGYAEMEAGFNQGKIAMMINGPWSWDNARKSKINFGVATDPYRGRQDRHAVRRRARRDDLESQPEQGPGRRIPGKPLLQINGLKTINADVPLGTPANKALFAELKVEPEHPGHHGKRPGGPPDAEQPGNGPLLVVDAIGAGKHHARPPVDQGRAGCGGEADHDRQLSN